MEKRVQVEQLSTQIATLRGRLSAIGDPLVLSSTLTVLQEEYETVQSEYEAITIALEALRDADREIQTRFSPELGRVAARYMSEENLQRELWPPVLQPLPEWRSHPFGRATLPDDEHDGPSDSRGPHQPDDAARAHQ